MPMRQFSGTLEFYLSNLHIPTLIRWTDVVEVIIIAVLTYHVLVWIRDTKAWNLLKGLMVILVFFVAATILNMTTILWLGQHVFSVAVIAIVVVLQPELRRALDTLGRNSALTSFMMGDIRKNDGGRFSDRTIFEIVRACQ
ncbi:MAG: TIGR00159 family protein, partial [Lachnospiraceae bacterium]|nr:TIGR00159 family protein [Lachnospiraceae bacterium]